MCNGVSNGATRAFVTAPPTRPDPTLIYFPFIPYLGVGDPRTLRSGATRQWMALRAGDRA